LIHHWNQTNDEWDDPVSKRIEEQHINPLLDAIRMAVGAMESMEETITKAHSDSS
jgi:hypothetical protein